MSREQHDEAGSSSLPFAGPSPAEESDGTADPRFRSGQVLLNRFRIVRPIGGGGMGEVFEAEDLELGRIALKTIRQEIVSSPEIFGRFRQEVLVARKVAGPQVCRVHELFLLPASDGLGATAFLTMEFIGGLTLSGKLRRDGPLPWKEARPIALELCAGLGLIHEKGIIHRDLKPSNIMLSTENGRVRTVLMDFGLARDSRAALERIGLPTDSTALSLSMPETMVGDILGTPDYMAPEQFEAGAVVSPATDIYAFGIVLYELVTGVHPFTAPSPMAAAIHRARQPKRPSSIQRALPRQCDRVIRRCLEYEPEARFASTDELSKALRGGPSNLKNLREDRPWLVFALAVVLIAVAAWGSMRWWRASQIYHPDAKVLAPYNDGVRALKESNYIRATRQLQVVTKQDPAFAMAHVRLAEAWADLDFEGNAQRELLLATPGEPHLSSIDRQRSEAIQAMVVRDFPHAQGIYRSMIDQLDATDLPAGYVDLGWAFERSGDTLHALENYRKAASLDTNNAAAFTRIGVLESRLQHLPEAQNSFDHAQAIFTAEVDEEGLAGLDFERGYAANQAEQDEVAKQELNRALEEAEKIPSVQLQIRTLTQLSSLAYFSPRKEDSVEYAQRAIRLAQDNRLDSWAADAFARMASAQLALGHLDKAQDAIDEAFQMVHQSPQPRVEALANFTLASLMDQKHQPDRVIAPAQAAFAYYTQVGDPIDATKAQQLLTRVQRNKGDLTAALASGMQLLAVSAKTGNKGSVIQGEELVGTVLMAQEDYEGALPHFEKSVALAGDGLYRPYELNHLAETLWKLGRYTESDERLGAVTGNEKVLLRATQIRIQSLLSRMKFAPALALVRQTLAANPKMDEDSRLSLIRDAILAEAELGTKQQATTEFVSYLASRPKEDNPNDIAAEQLGTAELELALGQDEIARDDAQQALTYFKSQNRRDSALRAAAVAAQACKALKDGAGYQNSSAKVVDLLAQLQHTWTPQTFQTYRARPDLVALTGALQ